MYGYESLWVTEWMVKPYGSTAPMWAVWDIETRQRVSPWFNLSKEAVSWADQFWRKKVDQEFEQIVLGDNK